MLVKRYIFSVFAVFAFFFLYEWFVHGFLLMGFYVETASVWRDFTIIASKMPLAVTLQFLLALWTTFVFVRFYKEGGIANGLRFGLYFGMFAGILSASWYLWLPIPVMLGWSWFLSGVIEGLGAGWILGAIYARSPS